MTWTINMNGHLTNPEHEIKVVEKTKEFVAELLKDESLGGPTYASFSGFSGTHDLRPTPEPGD